MTLRYIDPRPVILYVSPIDSFQQVAFTHGGLFIDGSLNVAVVLIDPPRSLQAARPLEGGSGGRGRGQGNLRAIRHKWVHNRWCEQIIVAGLALKNTDRSDYLFTRNTWTALTRAKHLSDASDEVRAEWINVPRSAVTLGLVNFASFINSWVVMPWEGQQHYSTCV